MRRTRLFHLIEGYLDGSLTPAERQELAAAVDGDPEIRDRFTAQVLLARRLRAALRPPAGASTWDKISGLIGPQEPARRQRVADRVDAALDQQRTARRSLRRRYVAGVVLATAAIAVLVARPGADRSAAPTAQAPPAPEPELPSESERAPRVLAPPPIEKTSPPPPLPPAPPPVARLPSPSPYASPSPSPSRLPLPHPRTAAASPPPPPAPLDTPAALTAEMIAAGEPALAARGDVLQYLGFDGPRPLRAIRGRLRPRFTQLTTGLSGTGLRTYFHRDQVGLPGGGARVFIAASALSDAQASPPTPAPAHDELHLRYHVQLSEDFDFAGGGVLPGLCLGGCGAPGGVAARGDLIRPRWTPFGELVFDRIPGTRPADGRWGRFLGRGTWHSIELRVKLNRPGSTDGEVQAWLDGERVVSLTGLRLRDTDTTHLQGVWFHTMYRPAARHPPTRDGHATFDNLAVSPTYLGPRPPP